MKIRFFLLYKLLQYFLLIIVFVLPMGGGDKATYMFNMFFIIFLITSGVINFILRLINKNNAMIIIADVLSIIFVFPSILSDIKWLLFMIIVPYVLIITISKIGNVTEGNDTDTAL